MNKLLGTCYEQPLAKPAMRVDHLTYLCTIANEWEHSMYAVSRSIGYGKILVE